MYEFLYSSLLYKFLYDKFLLYEKYKMFQFIHIQASFYPQSLLLKILKFSKSTNWINYIILNLLFKTR